LYLLDRRHPERAVFQNAYDRLSRRSAELDAQMQAAAAGSFTREGTKVAGEFALDFMFWPTADRKFGWFVEPTYSYSFSRGREQSFAVSVGLLVAIP
jgi:hypothetical protein